MTENRFDVSKKNDELTKATSLMRSTFYNMYEHSISLALQDYAQAIKLNPNDAESYNGRALLYASLEKYQLSRQDIEIAVALAPLHTQYQHSLSIVNQFLSGKIDSIGFGSGSPIIKYDRKEIDDDFWFFRK